MQFTILLAAATPFFIGLPAQDHSLQPQRISDQFVMPQSRARRIAIALDNWTLKSGERPKAVRIARDCISATGFIMQRGSGSNGVNQDAMPGMTFWSSINGAAILRATQNGGLEPQTDGDTAYKRKFATDEYKTAMSADQLPAFIRDQYAECELIRKRFGG